MRSLPVPPNRLDKSDGIDLRQIRQDVEQSAKRSGNRKIHALPDDRLRFGIGVRVPSVVQDLHQADSCRVELFRDAECLIVAALFHFMPFERRSNENRDDEFPLPPRHLRERKHRPGAGAFASRADDDDDREPAQEGLDSVPRFLQGLSGQLGVVPGSQASRRVRSDHQPLFFWHVGQREFIRVEKSRGDDSPESLRVSRVRLLRDEEVAAEQSFQRPQDIAAAAAGAEK